MLKLLSCLNAAALILLNDEGIVKDPRFEFNKNANELIVFSEALRLKSRLVNPQNWNAYESIRDKALPSEKEIVLKLLSFANAFWFMIDNDEGNWAPPRFELSANA